MPIDPPEITQSEELLVAAIYIETPRSDMPRVMGAAIAELRAALTDRKVTPTGPLLAHHLKMEPGTFTFNVGFPIAAPLISAAANDAAPAPTAADSSAAAQPAGESRVVNATVPAATVARTIYHGPFEGLHGAWEEFSAWVKSRGLQPSGGLWEVYISGPEEDPNPATFRTELNLPLVSATLTAAAGAVEASRIG